MPTPTLIPIIAIFILLPLCGHGQNPDSIAQQLEQAERLTDALEYVEALNLSDQTLEQLRKNAPPDDALLMRLYSLRAKIFLETAQYEAAVEAAESCLEIGTQARLMPNVACANALYYKAMALFSSKPQEVMALFQEALAQYEQLGESVLAERATTHRRMSVLYRRQRDFDQANFHLRQALGLFQNSSPPDSSGIADTYISQALTLEAQGVGLDSTFLIYQKAKQIYQAIYGMSHPQVAKSLDYMGRNLIRRSKFEEAITVLQESKRVYTEVYGENHPTVGRVYNFLGMSYTRLGKTDDAIRMAEKGLAININTMGAESLEARNSYNTLGNLYRHKGDYRASRQCFEAALRIQHALFGEENEDTGLLYDNLGQTVESQGDYALAGLYFQRALDLKVKCLGDADDRVAESLYSLGNNQRERGQYTEALETLKKAASIYVNRYGDTAYYELANLYQDIGVVYKEMQDYGQSLYYYGKASIHYGNTVGEPHVNIAILLQRMASVYQLQGQAETALDYYKQAKENALNSVGPSHAETANVYRGMGEVYLAKGMFLQSRMCLDSARLILGYRTTHPKDFDMVSKPAYLYEVFEVCTRYIVQKAEDLKGTPYLDDLSMLYDNWLALIEYILLQPQTEAMRLNYQQDILPIVEGAIATRMLQKPKNRDADIFQLMESAKARQLTAYLQSNNRGEDHTYGVPDSLIAQLRSVETDIAFYNQQQRSRAIPESPKENYDQKLFELTQAKVSLQQLLKEDYPEYYSLRYQPNLLPLKTAQQQLGPDQTLLSYFWGNDVIYLFLIQKDGTQLLEIKEVETVKRLCERMTLLLQQQNKLFAGQSTAVTMESLSEEYTTVAYSLYEYLIAPVANNLSHSLIIIPDDLLSTLPFELLLTTSSIPNRRNFAVYPYLLKKHAISYAYSAASWYQNKISKHRQTAKEPVLVMAPFSHQGYEYEVHTKGYTDFNTFSQEGSGYSKVVFPVLPNSAEAATKIADIWQGEKVIDKIATKSYLQEHGYQYRILHLIVHGNTNLSNKELSLLAFSETPDGIANELLYLDEIYLLKLNADLVVLSACETGIGHFQPAEGAFSLARAFLFTGAKSVVASIWLAEDAGAKELMVYFHHFLNQGLDKDQALQQAKLKYIAMHPGFQSHPFFWGGIIAIGDMSPID
ncbi:CHAT domain-containing protein [Phaeodactylibacter xiamenensis]|uniref:CHAT domain-containing protein n=1 Tax=Phaeodactylibacter xiamenensis TaxID=1524460 RepID=UPI0024A8B233|nr:CHAT domain-containing protein [Phaeodactylibacter xiamenensis]